MASALARSPRLSAAAHGVEATRAEAAAIAATLGPQVTVEAFARLQPAIAVPAGLGVATGPTQQLQEPFGYGAQVTLTQPLTGLFTSGYDSRGANRRVDAARLRAGAEREHLVAEVEEAFWRHAAAVQAELAAQARLAAAQARERQMENLTRAGATEQSALLAQRVEVANAEAAVATAAGSVAERRALLFARIGRSPSDDRPIDTTLRPPARARAPAASRTGPDSLPLRALDAEAGAAAERCTAAGADLFPQIALVASAAYTQGSLLVPPNAYAGAVLRWPAWDWGLLRAQRRAACERAAQAQATTRDARDLAGATAVRLRNADAIAERRHRALERGLAAATERERVVRERAGRGAATEADLADATAGRAEAAAALAQATADWRLARSAVERLDGR